MRTGGEYSTIHRQTINNNRSIVYIASCTHVRRLYLLEKSVNDQPLLKFSLKFFFVTEESKSYLIVFLRTDQGVWYSAEIASSALQGVIVISSCILDQMKVVHCRIRLTAIQAIINYSISASCLIAGW